MTKKDTLETSKSKKKVTTKKEKIGLQTKHHAEVALPIVSTELEPSTLSESSSGNKVKSKSGGNKGADREEGAMKNTGVKAEKIKNNENEDFVNTIDLIEFLDQNQDVDFLVFDLQTEDSLNKLNFINLLEKKTMLVFQAKAFQRLLRIIPEKNKDVALLMLKNGIHSALQIAAMTRRDFMRKFADMLDDNGELADAIYKNALEKRSVILIQYMNVLQNREPHISAARFN